jgi:hypothetical protein
LIYYSKLLLALMYMVSVSNAIVHLHLLHLHNHHNHLLHYQSNLLHNHLLQDLRLHLDQDFFVLFHRHPRCVLHLLYSDLYCHLLLVLVYLLRWRLQGNRRDCTSCVAVLQMLIHLLEGRTSVLQGRRIHLLSVSERLRIYTDW